MPEEKKEDDWSSINWSFVTKTLNFNIKFKPNPWLEKISQL